MSHVHDKILNFEKTSFMTNLKYSIFTGHLIGVPPALHQYASNTRHAWFWPVTAIWQAIFLSAVD